MHTQVSVQNVITLTVATRQSLPREDTGNTPVLQGKQRGRENRQERGENSHPKRVTVKRAEGAGPAQLICTLPSVSHGTSCYTDGTTPVGVSPRGVVGHVLDSHAHNRILKYQDLECLWSLDSSKSIGSTLIFYLYFFCRVDPHVEVDG